MLDKEQIDNWRLKVTAVMTYCYNKTSLQGDYIFVEWVDEAGLTVDVDRFYVKDGATKDLVTKWIKSEYKNLPVIYKKDQKFL